MQLCGFNQTLYLHGKHYAAGGTRRQRLVLVSCTGSSASHRRLNGGTAGSVCTLRGRLQRLHAGSSAGSTLDSHTAAPEEQQAEPDSSEDERLASHSAASTSEPAQDTSVGAQKELLKGAMKAAEQGNLAEGEGPETAAPCRQTQEPGPGSMLAQSALWGLGGVPCCDTHCAERASRQQK
jgi:hypothetical protein